MSSGLRPRENSRQKRSLQRGTDCRYPQGLDAGTAATDLCADMAFMPIPAGNGEVNAVASSSGLKLFRPDDNGSARL